MSDRYVEIPCGVRCSPFCWNTAPVRDGDPSKHRTNCLACFTCLQNQTISKEDIKKFLPKNYFILRTSGKKEYDWEVDIDLKYDDNYMDYVITFSKKIEIGLGEGILVKPVTLLKFIKWNEIPIEKFNDYYKPRSGSS